MTIDEARTYIVGWSKKLCDEGFLGDNQGSLSCRIGETMLISPRKKKLSVLNPDDIILVDIQSGSMTTGANPPADFSVHREIYRNRKDVNALVHSFELNFFTCSKSGKTIYPLLDDMAQIVGPTARTAAYTEPVKNKVRSSVVKKLKKRNAVLLSDNGALCGGNDLDDTHAVCQVFMKGCKCFIETEFLGGGKRINPLETRLMRLVYLMKYSKQTVENR